MAADEDKRKQPKADALKKLSKFSERLFNLLVAGGSHNIVGVATGLYGIGSDALQKPQDALILDTRLQENRRQIRKEVEQQARRDGCTLDFDSLDEAAQDTMTASIDFKELLDNRKTLTELAVSWRRKRAKNLLPGNEEFYKYHDLLVVKNLEALLPLLPSKPDYQENLLAYVTDAINALGAQLAKPKEEWAAFERKYRGVVAETLNYVELFIEGKPLHKELRKQTLSVAYVTLTLTQGRSLAELPGDVQADALLDALQSPTKRVLVLGKAGCGKTTMMRWLALEATQPMRATRGITNYDVDYSWQADLMGLQSYSSGMTNYDADYRAEDNPRILGSGWRGKVPFYLRLRDWETSTLPTPDEFHKGGAPDEEPPPGWAKQILKEGRGLLLLDGLDELSLARRQDALKWIRGLTRDYSADNVIVVTSRPAALEEGALKDADFAEYEIRDLSPYGRAECVRRWHEAVRRQLGDAREDVKELAEREHRLLAEMKTNYAVGLLAANPLLCALLCALNRLYRESLPQNEHDLCQSACSMLAYDRDWLNKVPREVFSPAYYALNKTMRLAVAQHLAYLIAREEGSRIGRGNAAREVATAIGGAQNHNYEEAEQVLSGLEQRSGLIRPCGQNDVEFVHNSLRDYLAALEFVERDEIDFLIKKVDAGDVERWEPILLFAAGSDRSRTYVQSLMEALLTTQGLSAKCRNRREIIVLKAHGRLAFRLTTALEQQISALRNRMLPINTFKKAEALAEAGETAVEFLARHEDMSEKEAAACVRGLGKMNSERAREQLRDYLHSDHRPSVLTELAAILPPEDMLAVVSYAEIPTVLAGLQTEDTPEAYRPFIRDLTPLSRMTQLQELFLDNTQVSDLTPLSALTQLQFLSLDNTQVSDLTPLSGMRELHRLFLRNTPVSDLTPLSGMRELHRLFLTSTQVSDLTPLNEMTQLRTLSCDNTPVSDLTPLSTLTQLQFLSLSNTQVSSEEVQRFEHLRQSRGLSRVKIIVLG